MPRLIGRGQTTAAARASPSLSTSPADLPNYQPPCCPLTDGGRRALGDLSSNRRTALYEAQLRDSLRQLGSAVGLLHERLGAQTNRLGAMRGRRQEKGAVVSPEEQRLQEHLRDFESIVAALTHLSERAVRDNIDKKVELEDDASVLADLFTAVAANTQDHGRVPRRHSNADVNMALEVDTQDQKESHDTPSTLHTFRERGAEKLAKYTDKLTPYQRYACNNDYASFKKLWHDAAAGEDGPPLPDASKWFSSDGQPLMDRPGSTTRRGIAGAPADGEQEDNRNDDDDIAVAHEVLSLNCPLTLRPMEEPYSSVKCHHTFEKASLLDYLPASGQVQCPQTGCSQTFSRTTFDRDFELNQAMLRRIQRSKQTAHRHDLDDNDDEDVEENDDKDPGISTAKDYSLVISRQMRTRGRLIKEERRGTLREHV